jgi:hypothetical protein
VTIFQVLTATGHEVTVSWDMAPCSLVDKDRYFRRSLLLSLGSTMEAVSCAETFVNIYYTVRCYNPENADAEEENKADVGNEGSYPPTNCCLTESNTEH